MDPAEIRPCNFFPVVYCLVIPHRLKGVVGGSPISPLNKGDTEMTTIISVWEITETGERTSNEATATVSFPWQGALLAQKHAVRYGIPTAVFIFKDGMIDPELVRSYDRDGDLLIDLHPSLAWN